MNLRTLTPLLVSLVTGAPAVVLAQSAEKPAAASPSSVQGIAPLPGQPNLLTTNKWFCAAGHDREACPPGSEGVLVQRGRLFVLGDHRGASADSRYHYSDSYHGTIPENRVVGRAFVVVWPPSHRAVLDVPSTFTAALATPGSPLALGVLGALPVTWLRRRRR